MGDHLGSVSLATTGVMTRVSHSWSLSVPVGCSAVDEGSRRLHNTTYKGMGGEQERRGSLPAHFNEDLRNVRAEQPSLANVGCLHTNASQACIQLSVYRWAEAKLAGRVAFEETRCDSVNDCLRYKELRASTGKRNAIPELC